MDIRTRERRRRKNGNTVVVFVKSREEAECKARRTEKIADTLEATIK